MNNATINDAVRTAIRINGSKLVSVEAVVKSGDIKRFVFSDAMRPTHIQSIATVSGVQAAETRKRNNPDLINVWDINEKRWRCFDVNAVLTLRAEGEEHFFRVYRTQCYRVA